MKKWIAAIPNDRGQLEKLAAIHLCKHHFDCGWYTVQGGGERPTQPPSIFSGVLSDMVISDFVVIHDIRRKFRQYGDIEGENG